MNEAENRLWNTIQLANCEGCMLKINKKGAACTLGRIMKYNHNLAEKYYEFTLANGDSVTLEELSVLAVDCDIDNQVVFNIYIDDDYEVGCCINDILANCEGCMLKINEKGNAFTLGRIMEYDHSLDAKYYEFTLTNGDSVMLEELSVYVVDCDRDNRVVINIYIDDDYEVGCFTNDFLADDRNFQYYSIERVYENIPDVD